MGQELDSLADLVRAHYPRATDIVTLNEPRVILPRI